MTGLPKPSQVEGNTTRSAAAYASATDSARPTLIGTGASATSRANTSSYPSSAGPVIQSRTSRSGIDASSVAANAIAPGMFFRGIARVGCSSTRSSASKPKARRVASRSPRRGSRSNALRMVTASKPRFSSSTREWSLIVTCSEFSRRGGIPVARRARALPRQIVMVEHHCAVVRLQHLGGELGGVGVDRQRAEVLDHDEVGTRDRGREPVRFGLAPVDRLDREEGEPDVVGSQAVVELAGDAAHRESELVERPLPFACLDRDAVGAAEPVGELDGDGGGHGPRIARTCASAPVSGSRGRVPCARCAGSWRRASARATASSRSRRTIAEPETKSSIGGST